jgi:hypothetical protein
VERPYELVYILGAGHCGSTLLNLLLNAHPQALGLSEIERLSAVVRKAGTPELDDPMWRRVKACVEENLGRPFNNAVVASPRLRRALTLPEADVRSWARSTERLLECISKAADRRVLVDASKFPQRLVLLLRGGLPVRVIHLRRDGRAVVNSYRRKNASFSAAYRRWAVTAASAIALQRRVPTDRWLTVYYEDLATETERELRRICAFIGLEYQASMLAFRRAPDLGIGGNRMRTGADERIVLDRAWRRDTPWADRLRFAVGGGLLNRQQGYPFVGERKGGP